MSWFNCPLNDATFDFVIGVKGQIVLLLNDLKVDLVITVSPIAFIIENDF